jgi:hypothetical protein
MGLFYPRLAYKWKINDNNIVRFNTGTGFRIVNLFTEEHAALTGSREVIARKTRTFLQCKFELFEEDVY